MVDLPDPLPESVDTLVPDPIVAKEFGVTTMSLWRWDQDEDWASRLASVSANAISAAAACWRSLNAACWPRLLVRDDDDPTAASSQGAVVKKRLQMIVEYCAPPVDLRRLSKDELVRKKMEVQEQIQQLKLKILKARDAYLTTSPIA